MKFEDIYCLEVHHYLEDGREYVRLIIRVVFNGKGVSDARAH